MVFDFFKKRASEGMSQWSNFSDKARQGKFSEGLLDAATYTAQTNKAFADGLAKSRNKILYDLEAVFSLGMGKDSSDLYQELEDVLIRADIGMATATDVIAELQSFREDSTQIITQQDLMSVLRGKLVEALSYPPNDPTHPYQRSITLEPPCSEEEEGGGNATKLHIPTVLFIMGANGMGKTTTIGKLAYRLRTEGNLKVLVAACDTFRAGAVEQLEMWANRAQVDCYGPMSSTTTTTSSSSSTTSSSSLTPIKTSPSAVLYGALDKAIAEKYNVLLVDTSGRLSNNEPLTEELIKMKRVIQKRLSIQSQPLPLSSQEENPNPNNRPNRIPIPNLHVPHETLLVIDAAQGRMALESARVWNQQLGLTGLILTKLDGSARGGSVVAVSRELGLPVKLIGVGEKMEDLKDFHPETFVDSLLGIGKAGGNKLGINSNNNDNNNNEEGALLAKRLMELRNSRDERNKVIQSSTQASIPNKKVERDIVTTTLPMNVPNRPLQKNTSKKKKQKGR